MPTLEAPACQMLLYSTGCELTTHVMTYYISTQFPRMFRSGEVRTVPCATYQQWPVDCRAMVLATVADSVWPGVVMGTAQVVQ